MHGCNTRSRAALAPILLSAALLLFATCDNFFLANLLDGSSGLPLSVSPAEASVAANADLALVVSGGYEPYRFEVVSGGGSVSADGVFSAPGASAVSVVAVADRLGTSVRSKITTIVPSARDVDYRVESVSHVSGFLAGGPVHGSFTVVNDGGDDGAHPIDYQVFASPDATLDIGSDYAIAGGTLGPLAAGASATGLPFSGTWPTAPGAYHLIVRIITAPDDLNTTNNTASSSASAITGPPPADMDYTVALAAPTDPTPLEGTAVIGTFTISNAGPDDGTNSVSWAAYVSADDVPDGSDTLIAFGTITPLASGESSLSIDISGGAWPQVIADTDYYLIVVVSALDEPPARTGNNYDARVYTVRNSQVDYVVSTVTRTGATVAGGPATGTFAMQNTGAHGGAQTVIWKAYVASDPGSVPPGAGDILIDSGERDPLAAGASAAGIAFSGTWPVTPGTWYLKVLVQAADDVDSSNNWAASGPVATTAPPAGNVDYQVTTGSADPTRAGTVFLATFDVANIGDDPGSQTLYWTAYLSADATVSGDDVIVGAGDLPPLGPGASHDDVGFTGTWPTTAGVTRYLIVRVLAGDDVAPANNTDAGAAVTIQPADVDYEVTALQSTGATVAGGPLSGTFDLTNNGIDTGSQLVTWAVYVSLDTTVDPGTDVLVATGSRAALAGGASATGLAFSGTWPITPGPYYLVVRATAADEIAPADNDGASLQIVTTAPHVDYRVESVVVSPATQEAGSDFSETFTFRNEGTNAGGAAVLWYAYASADPVYDPGDTLVAAGSVGPLGGGAVSTPVPIDGTWPANAGVYYLVVRLQAADDVNPLNNTGASGSFTLTGSSSAVDYIVSSVSSLYPTVVSGSPVSETFTLRNIGDLTGTDSVAFTTYLSTDSTLDGGDPVVGSGTTAALPSGGTRTGIYVNGSWAVAPGTYYLIVSVSAGDEEPAQAGNNVGVAGPFTVNGPPNYTVSAMSPPPTASEVGFPLSGEFTIRQTTPYAGTAAVSWSVWISDDPGLGGDTLIQSGAVGPLAADDGAPGGPDEITVPFSGAWPLQTGDYYLIVSLSAIDDNNPADNVYTYAAPFAVYIREQEPNDDVGPFKPNPPQANPPDLANIHTVGVLELGKTIIIRGELDAVGAFDTFRFQIGPGVTAVATYAQWSSGFDSLDLFMWDELGFESTSIDTAVDREPSAGWFRISGWAAPEYGYVGVRTFSNPGTVYLLRIRGE